MSPDRDQRIARLRGAAQARHQAAVRRAEEGLRRLVKNGEPITFRSVARTGNVSLDFLYRDDELRTRISRLRDQQKPSARKNNTADNNDAPTNSVVAALTAKLRQAREENGELRRQLSAAHGELLALRRARLSSPPSVRSDELVTDASVTS